MYGYDVITELLDMQGWKIENSTIKSDSVTLQIERKEGFAYECLNCGELFMFAYDHYGKRCIEDFPICGKRCFIEFRQSRIYCNKCNKVVSEKLSFVDPNQHQSIRFQRFLASLCDHMPITDVAELTGIGKDPLYRIDKLYLKERHEKFCSDNDVTYLGIDEIAIRKGHRYAVVFYDLRRGQVIGLEQGRRRIDTSRFFRKWGKEKCLNVKGVCTDLWAPYHKSVRTHLKNAVLVFDKFHVFKYLSDAIEKVRRIEQSNASKDGKALLKGSRWIILKNDLNNKQKRRLKELMENNKNISMAVMLKEDFAAFYEAPTRKKAEEILEEWTKECEESNLRPFKQLAKRLNRWKEGILSYFDCRITNGKAEGINNKIKVIKRRSYGFHDMEYFFLKILKATGFIPNMKLVYP